MKDGKDQDRTTDRPEEGRRPGIPVREFARKLISTGAEAVAATEEGLRNLVGEVNARETVSGLIESVSKGTDSIQSTLVREARRYLDAINLQDELGRVLSNYTIEVNARINFVPRDKSADKKKSKSKADKPDKDAARLDAQSLKFKFIEKVTGEESEEGGE